MLELRVRDNKKPLQKHLQGLLLIQHCCFRDPAGARTRDPNIKSVVLYRLSYRINARQKRLSLIFGGANVGIIFLLYKHKTPKVFKTLV